MIKRIIRRMAEFKNIHTLVLLLDSRNTENEDDLILVELAGEQDYMLMQKKEDLLSYYMQKSKQKKSKIYKIYDLAKSYGFIDDKKPPYDSKDIYVFVTPVGQTFIFKRWFIPTGLIRKVAEK